MLARHALIIASVAWPPSKLPPIIMAVDDKDPFALQACATQLMEQAGRRCALIERHVAVIDWLTFGMISMLVVVVRHHCNPLVRERQK